MSRLTHLDAEGRARMVDVSGKPATAREAVAAGLVRMSPPTRELAMSGNARKGDVIAAAEIAGIMAAKKTAELIPLCHPLPLTKAEVRVTPEALPALIQAGAPIADAEGFRMHAESMRARVPAIEDNQTS